MHKPTQGYLIVIAGCALYGAFAVAGASSEGGGTFSLMDVLLGGGIGGGFAFAVTYGLHWRRRLIDGRAEKQWKAVEQEIVRTEKVEQLGHTAGGLSEASDAQAGQLSDAESPLNP